jgi:polyphosphate glucokinase
MTMAAATKSPATEIRRILAIDIGGSHVKAAIVAPSGRFLVERVRVDTPKDCPPHRMIQLLRDLVPPLGAYDHISIGFPGMVRNGKVLTAPNLGTARWAGFPLGPAVAKALAAPTRLHNDADVQGLAVIKGKGLELVCTLGTGLGTAWFRDGELMPHMELAHFALAKKYDLDNYLGDKARHKIGNKHWRKRVDEVIAMLHRVLNYDRLYLGGGNSKHLKKQDLPDNVRVTSNDAGMRGSAFVWRDPGAKPRR